MGERVLGAFQDIQINIVAFQMAKLRSGTPTVLGTVI